VSSGHSAVINLGQQPPCIYPAVVSPTTHSKEIIQ
jgi:hypothetical protein